MKIVILDHPRENQGEIDWSDYNNYGEVIKYEHINGTPTNIVNG